MQEVCGRGIKRAGLSMDSLKLFTNNDENQNEKRQLCINYIQLQYNLASEGAYVFALCESVLCVSELQTYCSSFSIA